MEAVLETETDRELATGSSAETGRGTTLTEQEALREVSAEIQALRGRTSELEHELDGVKRYGSIAKLNALGVRGKAGVGLTEKNSVLPGLGNAHNHEQRDGRKEFSLRCDGDAIAIFRKAADVKPDFPFSYWAMAICAAKAGEVQGSGSGGIALMLDFVTVGTNDLKRAGEFYDAVLGVLGGTRSHEGERLIMWSGPAGAASLAVITPFDKSAAAPGNGTMIALAGGDPETVQAVHAKALAMGGADEGSPGPRGTGDFYGGYFRDPDGNKLVAYCRQEVR